MPPNPDGNQSTKYEYEARLEVVASLIEKGLTQAQYVRYAREKLTDWNVSDRQHRRYYQEAMRRFGDEATGLDRAAYHVRELRRLDFIYGAAVKVQDYKTALSAIDKTIRLLKLDDPTAFAAEDWRQTAQQQGLNPSELFERMLTVYAEVESGNPENEESATD